MNSHRQIIEKSPLMLVGVLVIWGILVLRYDPYLFPLWSIANSTVGKIIVSFAVLWMNLVWFYGVFHVMSVVFSKLSKPIPLPIRPEREGCGRVAILYTTKDDFRREAAESCLRQDYSDFRVFFLDDSTSPDERARVEEFCRDYTGRCTLVRRSDKSGFKAGNLNHALRTVASDCEYFAVVDADEVLPSDFLSATVPHFRLDKRIGFVQANHRYVSTDISPFASDMAKNAELHWGLFLPARNKYGFVLFYGHGAVIRTDVWRELKGFPRVVCEDIAFAAKAREHGYLGLFTRDVVAEERFPETYSRFLRREVKVAKGTMQFMLGPARTFFRSKSVTFAEKMDLLASAAILFLPIVFLGFLVFANVALPVIKAWNDASGHDVTSGVFREWLLNVEPLGAGVRRLWSWDFYLLTVLTILAPLVYQLKVLLRSPARLLSYAARSTAVCLSVVPSVAWELASYLLVRRVEFTPTGDRTNGKVSRRAPSSLFSASIGILLLAFAVLSGHLAILTIALSFLLHPILLRVSWSSRGLGLLMVVPFLVFLAVFCTVPFLLIGVAGALSIVVPTHH
jgi:cellulose synthase/poly-beta-1,6-N-acetylglucosamine synthase-like glycosyltransferase